VAPLKGLVVVRTNDPASAEFFRHEGLSLRDQKTSQQVPLEQARTYLPLGEYTLETAALRPGFKVSPRQFTVAADRTAYVTITFVPPPAGPSGAGAGPLPPEGPPPPPPPPGGPPPRPGRR
jgi:hypothetical protein